MNIKYHTINENGCSIRCKMFCDDWRDVRRAVLYAHGFGGHKETRAAVRFSEAALSKQKGTLVMAFDWPCHGEDARKKLKLADCSEYLGICTEYPQDHPAKPGGHHVSGADTEHHERRKPQGHLPWERDARGF